MYLKNIQRKGFLKYYTLIILVFIVFECIFSLLVKNFFYKNTESLMLVKSEELENILGGYEFLEEDEFKIRAVDYVKRFRDDNFVDVFVFDKNGTKLSSYTGAAETLPNLNRTKKEINSSNFHIENLKNGTRVIILTRAVRDNSGQIVGGVEYILPLLKTDKLIFNSILFSVFVMILLLLLLVLFNKLFIKSILTPINEVSKTSRKIALGDFKARLTTRYDGAIGELCDTVNFMAQKLDESEKLKNDFISSVSHELRTPLTAVKGWAETIQLGGEKDIEMNQRGLNIIVHESERLCGIVEELLDFSRMQSGRMILNLDKIDILAELSEAVYMFRERALEEKKLLLYSEPELLSPVLGDKNRLRQVFINIIDNALKYTEENGVINVAAKEEDDFINITISDNGCGIPSEHLPKVKEKFYKANMTKKGSGIGLAVANEIILLHSGNLEIKSEENIGTVVTICIPIMTSHN